MVFVTGVNTGAAPTLVVEANTSISSWGLNFLNRTVTAIPKEMSTYFSGAIVLSNIALIYAGIKSGAKCVRNGNYGYAALNFAAAAMCAYAAIDKLYTVVTQPAKVLPDICPNVTIS